MNKKTHVYALCHVLVKQVLLEEVEAVGLKQIVHDNAMGFWIGVRSACDNGTASIAIGIMLYVCLC